jgi:uncharacterized membrane protein YbaN (DUF454 family)
MTKNKLAHILGYFLTNSSGHPALLIFYWCFLPGKPDFTPRVFIYVVVVYESNLPVTNVYRNQAHPRSNNIAISIAITIFINPTKHAQICMYMKNVTLFTFEQTTTILSRPCSHPIRGLF